MNINILAKYLMYIGLGIVLVGVLIFLFSKMGFNVGKLPGDFNWKKEKFAVCFPIVSSIVVSIVLTIIINLFLWIFRK